jgi:DNA modification methylase
VSDYIVHADCFEFVKTLDAGSVRLVATDPPYFEIVKDHWDNQWSSTDAYVEWLFALLVAIKPKLTPDGSILFFGGVGKPRARPFFRLLDRIESTNLYTHRNPIVWGKRRAYGKSHDYLFAREEIAWYSVSPERTKVVFNVPLLGDKRGYAGFDSKYPAKSEYKRVTNVWTDITELFRPKRYTQKPIPLMERIISTHSNEGDLVVDPFCGWGTTGVAALRLGRRFAGSEAIEQDAMAANNRCVACEPGRDAKAVLK